MNRYCGSDTIVNEILFSRSISRKEVNRFLCCIYRENKVLHLDFLFVEMMKKVDRVLLILYANTSLPNSNVNHVYIISKKWNEIKIYPYWIYQLKLKCLNVVTLSIIDVNNCNIHMIWLSIEQNRVQGINVCIIESTRGLNHQWWSIHCFIISEFFGCTLWNDLIHVSYLYFFNVFTYHFGVKQKYDYRFKLNFCPREINIDQ